MDLLGILVGTLVEAEDGSFVSVDKGIKCLDFLSPLFSLLFLLTNRLASRCSAQHKRSAMAHALVIDVFIDSITACEIMSYEICMYVVCVESC